LSSSVVLIRILHIVNPVLPVGKAFAKITLGFRYNVFLKTIFCKYDKNVMDKNDKNVISKCNA